MVSSHPLIQVYPFLDFIFVLFCHFYFDATHAGEIDFNGFLPLLRAAEIKPGDKFVDIGSGTGKAVLLAACCFPLSMSLGVEIMQPLHDAALKSKSEVVKCKPAILKMHESSIKLIHGDSFKLRDDWLNADVLYCPCTCFTDEMMNELTSQLPKLKHGARVITTSRQLELPCLRQLTSLRAKYKRGMLQFFVYKYESPALENIKSKEANATDARASHVGKRQKIDSSQPRNEKKAKSNEIQ